MEEPEAAEPYLHRDRIQLADGRYLIYYTFDQKIFLNGVDKEDTAKTEDE
jgi:hypothetical protein